MLPPPNSPDFPAALKAARIAQNMSRADLARKAQINAVMPRRYEEPDAEDFSQPRHNTWLWLNYALGFCDKPSPSSEETSPSIEAGPLLRDATIDQIVVELRSRGATVGLTFPAA